MADFPTDGDDVIFGTSAGETIDALEGNDTVFGAGGNDILRGNYGDDVLSGGEGLDKLLGDRLGNDTASYAFAFGDVFADLDLGHGYLVAAGIANDKDTFSSIENLEGGLGDDDLSGNDFRNVLEGNGGDDDIFGRGGGDDIDGGAGDDELYGHSGDDLINGGSGADLVAGGDGSDTLKGGTGKDFLTGGYGRDGVSGGGGDDWIDGGPESDKLSGGTGVDTFVYDSVEGWDIDDRDLILDFDPGEDKIEFISQFVGGAIYIGNQPFTAEDEGQVRSFTKNGRTIVQYSEFGGSADAMTVLLGIHTLSQDNFV